MLTKALLDVGLEVGESVLDIWGRHLSWTGFHHSLKISAFGCVVVGR